MTVDDFKVGERVRHMSGGIGTVVDVGDYRGEVCVTVKFPPSPNPKNPTAKRRDWMGSYPNSWLTQYPNGLTKVD